jgi:hypothetical protein
MRFKFHPEAELELAEAADFYEAGLSGLGGDFSDEVERSSASCLNTPNWEREPTRTCVTSSSGGFLSQLYTLQRISSFT